MNSSNKLHRAFGDHLDTFPWKLWVTTTYRPYKDDDGQIHPVGRVKANKDWRKFIHKVRDRLPWRHRIEFIRVTEPHKTGSLHHHALLLGNSLENIHRLDLVEDCWWNFGKVRVEPYDPMKGAKYYLGKYLYKRDAVDYEITVSRSLHKWIDEALG